MLFQRQGDEHPAGNDRRYEILEATLRIIGEGGPDAVTFRGVAALAESPLSLITYHFASREDLLREAFRLYLSEAAAFISKLEHEKRPHTASGVVELLLEIVRREFAHDPAMVRVEYEMILYAARDPSVAHEFNGHERGLEARLARSLEIIGAPRPIEAARTLIDLVRGFEIERLTYQEAETEQLERRLRLVIDALIKDQPTTTSKGARHVRQAHASNRRRSSAG